MGGGGGQGQFIYFLSGGASWLWGPYNKFEQRGSRQFFFFSTSSGLLFLSNGRVRQKGGMIRGFQANKTNQAGWAHRGF